MAKQFTAQEIYTYILNNHSGKTYREIGEHLGISINGIGMRVSYLRRQGIKIKKKKQGRPQTLSLEELSDLSKSLKAAQ